MWTDLGLSRELGAQRGPWPRQRSRVTNLIFVGWLATGAPLFVRSRSVQRAQDFIEWAVALGVEKVQVDDGRDVGLLINTTPLGLRSDDAFPFDEGDVERATAAFDTVYASGGTRWVARFKQAGKAAIDGRTMRVGQGAAAFERFFPDSRAPTEVMAAAVERRLKPS